MKTQFLLALSLCACAWGQSTLTTPSAKQSTPSMPSYGSQGAYGTGDAAGVAAKSAEQNHSGRRTDYTGTSDTESTPSKPEESETIHPRPTQPKTEFETMVESSVGKSLPIFGSELFQDVPSTFAPVDRVPVRAEYVIGPGDELLIRAWGSIDLDARVVVDRNGQIYLPKVGALNVAGLRYEQLAKYLKSTISSQFKEFDVNVTIGQLRSIQIFLLGNVEKPGTYTVSSLSTLVNALFASGGPSSIGSMRNIQLKRGGKVVSELDLYDLLVLGDKSKDVALEPGDVIYIPPVGPQIAISGSVNHSAIFELRSETTLADALRFAGGLNNVAGSNRVIIEGIAGRKEREVAEFTLEQGLTHALRDGDLVRIFPVSPRFENAVTLRGAAAQPGRYPWREGMHVSDLIPSREALITRTYWNTQNALVSEEQSLFGLPTENTANLSLCKLSNAGLPTSVDNAKGNTKGNTPAGLASSRINCFAPDPTKGVAPTDFKRNPAEINWDYAVISRLNPADLRTELLTFNLGMAVSNPSSPANLTLQARDVVTVFSQADIPVSVEKRTLYVRVEGEVNAPGVYRVNPDQTLRDVIVAAGGLTSHSYLFAADFRRESTRLEQREKLKKLVSRLEDDIASRAATVDPHATPEETATQKAQLTTQQAYLQKLSQVEPTGRVVLDVNPKGTEIAALPPLPLEDNDVIRIPNRGGTVEVLGAVNNDNALIYHNRANVAQYLGKAGGPTREGDMGRIFVIRADGSVIARQGHSGPWGPKFESMNLMPGDAIVVPNKLFNSSILRGLRDWSQIFSQFALGVAAARVLGQ